MPLILQERGGDEETIKDEEEPEKMKNEMADKLDILMNMMFEYIKKTCFDQGMMSKTAVSGREVSMNHFKFSIGQKYWMKKRGGQGVRTILHLNIFS